MKTYSQLINEKFVNLLQVDDLKLKEFYKDQVWNVIQSSYAPIGGIGGSGFKNVDDMVVNIPFWKLAVKDKKVHAVTMYKDKGGRKAVAFGTDGSDYGKKAIYDIIKNEYYRSITEVSKGALVTYLKLIPWNILQNFTFTPEEVQKKMPTKVVIAVSDVPFEDIPADGQRTLQKFPHIKKYAYIRDIGGKPFFKMMLGTPDIRIK